MIDAYLVGGAVRDELLGRPAGDKDYVVVNKTPQEMTAAGFKPVGKDFRFFCTRKAAKNMHWRARKEKADAAITALFFILAPM